MRLAPQDGCFCLSFTILSSSFFGTECRGCFGRGFFGSRPPIPPSSLYLLTHLVSVLREIPNVLQIFPASSMPSRYSITALALLSSVPFTTMQRCWNGHRSRWTVIELRYVDNDSVTLQLPFP